MSRLFLSYARADDDPDYNDPKKSFVRRLYNDLKDAGFDVWWDRVSMPSRALTFLQEIRDAIAKVDRLILIVGPGAVSSDYVRAEWEFALSICKIVTPILRSGDYDFIPDPLKNVHCVDCCDTRDYSQALAELLDKLNELEEPLARLVGVPELPPNYLPRQDDLSRVRQKLLTDIDTPTVVTGTTKRAGLQGMGGIGKTVLASAVAHDCQVRRSFSEGIFWITLGQEPRLTHLQSQLGEWLGDNPRSFGNVEDGRRRLSSLMADRRCLIVLDDVWETEHVGAFDTLGERCRMLLTSRNLRLVNVLGAQSHTVDVLHPDEALTLLAQWARQDLSSLPPEAAEVARLCGYLPLALAMIGASLGERNNRWDRALHRLREADLERIRQDFPHYPYPDMLRAIEVSVNALSPELRARYFDLAVFPEDIDIPEAALKTFWKPEGYDEYDTEDVIDEFRNRSLIRVEENGGVRLHDLQIDYVQKRAGDLKLLHERLLKAYNPNERPWPEMEHDGYIYYHLGSHFLALGWDEQWHILLTESPDWLKKKFENCRGNSAFADDVALALRRFERGVMVDQLMPLVQLHTLRQVVNHRIGRYTDSMLTALVWLHRTAEAISHAQLRQDPQERFDGLMAIFEALHKQNGSHRDILSDIRAVIEHISDNDRRVTTMLQLAEKLNEVGETEESGKTLRDIEPFMHHLPFPENRVRYMTRLANILFDLGNKARATGLLMDSVRLAESIPSDFHRAAVLSDLAQALAQSGNYEGAEQVAQTIQSDNFQAEALSDLAQALAQSGQADEAQRLFELSEQVAQTIQEDYHRAEVLSGLAQALAESGQADEAQRLFELSEQVAQTIQSDYRRDQALSGLAQALVQSGDYERAEQVAQTIQSGFVQALALSGLAQALVQSGDYERAMQVPQHIQDDYFFLLALSDLARALVQSGDHERAEQVAQTIRGGYRRAVALGDVARALAQSGDHERAEQVAQTIQNDYLQVNVLSDLAQALAESGQADEARRLFELSEQVAQTVQDDDRRTEVLSGLAQALAQSGQADEARQLFELSKQAAQAIQEDYRRTEVLSGLAQALAQSGQADEARRLFELSKQAAQAIQEDYRRAAVLSGLAQALAQSGQADEARQLFELSKQAAQAIQEDYRRDEALSGLARALVQSGDYERAEHVVQTIQEDYSRFVSLSHVAQALAQSGDYERAEQVAQTIQEDYSRVVSLSHVAQALAQSGQADEARRLFELSEQVAQTIQEDYRRVVSLSHVAQALAQSGQADEARRLFELSEQVAQTIQEYYGRDQALSGLARALVQSGDYERAEQVAQAIQEDYSRAAARGNLAQALAQSGEYERAEQVAQTIQEDYFRAEALGELAAALTATGDNHEAERIARSISDNTQQSHALRQLAVHLMQAGDFGEALRVLSNQSLDEWLSFLAECHSGLVKLNVDDADGLYQKLLLAALDIMAWEQPFWGEVAQILRDSS